ncbi:MAG TPA: glycosyl hydrolase [Solirubrobacterales bacterium]|nr:glycosyl hydrolase [Solirubrobacterales bacterium]
MKIARAKRIVAALAAFLALGAVGSPPALAELPAWAPQLTLGIDGGYMGWSETEVEERAAFGAAVTRHEWDPAAPVADQDGVMEVASAEIGTRVHALLGANRLPPAGHYRQWVLEFVGRYGLGGSFWAEHPEYDEERFAITSVELGNEPYFGEMSAEEYAETVLPTLRAIEALELPVTVVLPSRVYGSDTSWMDSLYDRIPDLNDLFDAFADHPYWYGRSPAAPGPAGPLGRIATLRQRMDELGAAEKPIWITEYGQSTALCREECVSEEAQARHLRQMLVAVLLNPEWQVEMLSFFQLRDRGTGSGDRELQFGLLREDGSPKPAYELARAAVQAFR